MREVLGETDAAEETRNDARILDATIRLIG